MGGADYEKEIPTRQSDRDPDEKEAYEEETGEDAADD